LASVSKAITAVTVLKLVERGRLTLDDRVLSILDGLRPPEREQIDPRWRLITVRQCLNHSGGWDRQESGDPNGFGMRVARRLNVEPPVTARQLSRYMLGQPLDFDPGTRAVYSNFGFVLLGEIIERVTGMEYGEAVRQITLEPMHIGQI